MSTSLVMLATMGVLFACGVYLMLDRSLTRVLLGFLLFGNGANILIVLMAGKPGNTPIIRGDDLSTDGMTDPLPQALVLTAIVITFAMTAFLLALIYRSWRLVRSESLQDDLDDLRISLENLSKERADEASAGRDQEDTEFGDEAQAPVAGALDLDDDGSPAQRERAALAGTASASAAESESTGLADADSRPGREPTEGDRP